MNESTSRTVTAYFNIIEENPVLSQEDSKRLCQQISSARKAIHQRKTGQCPADHKATEDGNETEAIGQRAAAQLVASNLGLVFYVAKKYPCNLLPFEDLLGWGCLGLAQAADRAEPHEALFSNYAIPYIRNSIQEGIRSNRCVQLSRDHTGQLIKAKNFIESHPELADDELPPEVLRWKDVHQDAMSLDAEPETAKSLTERLADPQASIPGQSFQEDERSLLRQAVDALPDREAHLITRRFGLDGQEPVSLGVAGQELGISKQRAHVIYTTALNRVRAKYSEASRPV